MGGSAAGTESFTYIGYPAGDLVELQAGRVEDDTGMKASIEPTVSSAPFADRSEERPSTVSTQVSDYILELSGDRFDFFA
jgi:hypothetical protein